jgi:flagellar protein FliS
MFGSSSKYAANAYAKIGMETGVLAADPHKLITMLFDGALMAITNGIAQIQAGKLPEKGKSIGHAVSIVERGLQASLNKDVGGELAHNLHALYGYIISRLLQGNIHNDLAKLREAHQLLSELRGAWEQIAPGKTEVAEPVQMVRDGLSPRKSSYVSA